MVTMTQTKLISIEITAFSLVVNALSGIKRREFFLIKQKYTPIRKLSSNQPEISFVASKNFTFTDLRMYVKIYSFLGPLRHHYVIIAKIQRTSFIKSYNYLNQKNKNHYLKFMIVYHQCGDMC